MKKVTCAAIDCKYNNDNYKCEFNGITLSECWRHTLNEGYQQFWKCKNYEQSEEAKLLIEQFRGQISEDKDNKSI